MLKPALFFCFKGWDKFFEVVLGCIDEKNVVKSLI